MINLIFAKELTLKNENVKSFAPLNQVVNAPLHRSR